MDKLYIYGVDTHAPIAVEANVHNLLVRDDLIHCDGKDWLYFEANLKLIKEYTDKSEAVIIAYLNSDDSAELEFSIEKEKMNGIINHPNTEYYTPTGFAEAFNSDGISDLGYIAIVDGYHTLINN